MKKFFTPLLALTVGISASAQQIVAVTKTDQLITIANPATPTITSLPVSITGLTAGQTIAGIDYRPNTGELFALGYDATNGNSQLYVLNATTGVAVPVTATPFVLALGTGSIGFDFNPTVDRIRVVGANKKNYRLNPVNNTLAATDTDLEFAVGDVNAGSAPAIGACAYTNSVIASTATTLYNYDETKNILTLQNPPNAGTINTVGSSGITVNQADISIDMDIYYNRNTNTNIAYLSANTGTSVNDNLYTINLATGVATSVGQIGLLGTAIKDIAVVIDRTLPALQGNLIYALTNGTTLISFDSDNSSFIRNYLTITGVTAGQTLVGMDVRPSDLLLYALGYNAINREYQLYTINTTTGAATAINAAPVQINLGTGKVGVDFNPVADRLRVVGENDSSFRINPINGTVAATDGSLAYGAGDINFGSNPNVSGVAYTNSFNGTTATTLYGFDDATATLTMVNPPNAGTMVTVKDNILTLDQANLTTDIDFHYNTLTTLNTGYLVANVNGAGTADSLYQITTTGDISRLGIVGSGLPIIDIAVQQGSTPNALSSIEKASFKIYPNPVADRLNINLPDGSGNVEVTIVDMAGKIVMSNTVATASVVSLNVAELQSGFYMVNVSGKELNYTPSRFVKQ